MQNQHLMNELDAFFQSSYPEKSLATPISYSEPSIVTVEVDSSNPSNGNTIIKLLVIVGLILLVYHLVNYHSKLHNREERKKQL